MFAHERGRFLNTVQYLPMQLSRDDFFKLKGFKPFLMYAVILYVHKESVYLQKTAFVKLFLKLLKSELLNCEK
jgi:hypothetical protein